MIYGDSLDEIKNNMAPGELKFFNSFEPHIKKLFKDLAKLGFIRMIFDDLPKNRLPEIRRMINTSGFLHQNVLAFTRLDGGKRDYLITTLKDFDFETDDIAYQMFSIISHGYHTHIEDLKIHMELTIDFDSLCDFLGKTKRKFKPYMWMVELLKEISKDNDFLDFLGSKIRNSIVHFTYFYSNGKINFCDGIFDNKPDTMDLDKFMIESKNMNLLALGFFHMYIEIFKKPIK